MKKLFEFKLVNIFTASCLLVSTVYLASAVLIKPHNAQAATCGGAVVCNCGDIVTSDYTLTSDLLCPLTGTRALEIGADNIIIDGQNLYKIESTITGASGYGIYSNDYNNITIQNLNFSNLAQAVYITATALTNNININHNNFLNSHFAIITTFADNVTISDNTIRYSDSTAILLQGANHHYITNNILIGNGHTIFGPGLKNSTISNNQFIKNRYTTNITTAVGNTITNNTLADNEYTHMIVFNETAANRITTIGTPIALDIDLFNYDNLTACPTCSYTIATYPNESISTTLTPPAPPGNKILATFTPDQNGTYSVKVTATDPSNNSESRFYRFFIGPVTTQNITYYLNKIIPTHGQSTAQDTGSWLKTPSTVNNEFTCNYYIQASVEELPDFPISTINNISTNIWYNMEPTPPPGSGLDAWTGIQRYGTRYVYTGAPKGIAFDLHEVTPWNFGGYVKPTYLFNPVNWSMDYPWDWYNLMIKMETAGGIGGAGGNDGPDWQTQTGTTDPSQITINYSAPIYPLIQLVSVNPDINILSATQPDPLDNKSAQITLSGTGSTNITVDTNTRPFKNATSVIDVTGTSTLNVTGLAGIQTFENVKLDITPSAGTVTVVIGAWPTTGLNRDKTWTENGVPTTITTNHLVGDLLPNKNYYVYVNNDLFGASPYLSNASGEITFLYNGGFSTKTFIVRDTLFSRSSGGETMQAGPAPILINNNANQTDSSDVTLNLDVTGAKDVFISNQADLGTGQWIAYADQISWTLSSGLGTKTVYAIFRDELGQTSRTFSDSIELVDTVNEPTTPGETPTACPPLPGGLEVGNLLKLRDRTTVWIIGTDCLRHTFPNESTYFTWYDNFSNISVIEPDLMGQIALGKNVTVKPGTKLVKIESVATIYAVENSSKLRAIKTEEQAASLYGLDWNKKVLDVPAVFFVDYTIGADLTNLYPTGTITMFSGLTNYFYIENGQRRLIETDIFNRLFKDKFVIKNLPNITDYPQADSFPYMTMAELMALSF